MIQKTVLIKFMTNKETSTKEHEHKEFKEATEIEK